MSVTLNLTVIAGYFFNCVIVCRSFVLYIPFVFFFGLQRANCILFLCEGHTSYPKMAADLCGYKLALVAF